ncbi:YeiH family protein [Staphylococcus sp. 17KM0847]|uniref:YeiH family protein n=1 Tax=Staphylococcus sp. 17KM0847 TaxID=2583989 RepID=UPI0015DC58F5|nr:YeiH family protein [Staphylococcus sp. 17KM0847]QLK86788.1 YeiH family putative sulfate export transporter [Staphylococcus sp. 17KM0847]
MTKIKGLLLTMSIAIISTYLGKYFPIVGSAVFAIVIGMLINNLWRVPQSFTPGIRYSSKKILHYSIITLGFTLSFQSIGSIGLKSLPILILTLFICFGIVILLIKLLKIDTDTGILIGVGTSICGGSAIAATSPVIRAREDVIALSLSTVFLFNLVGVIIFPPIGHLFNMNQETFGFFAGTAINDTSSVVAASAVYGHEALEVATIVKLTRTLFIIPITIGLAIWMAKHNTSHTHTTRSWYKAIPSFIIWFLIAALISSIFHFSTPMITLFKQLALFLITIALAGVGLTVKFSQFKRAGLKPVLLGLLTWTALIIASLILLKIIGML